MEDILRLRTKMGPSVTAGLDWIDRSEKETMFRQALFTQQITESALGVPPSQVITSEATFTAVVTKLERQGKWEMADRYRRLSAGLDLLLSDPKQD